MRLKNDVAVITGAAQGIGAAFAVGFAREDLVGTALFLATDDSAFVTGQMIVHDGGLSFP